MNTLWSSSSINNEPRPHMMMSGGDGCDGACGPGGSDDSCDGDCDG